MAAVSTISKPEYFLYLGHEETEAGFVQTANSDFERAFQFALVMPGQGLAPEIKSEVEPGAISGLIENGDLGDAARRGLLADSGRDEIVAAIIGAQLDQSAFMDAWKSWDAMGTVSWPFSFEAARKLLLGNGGDAARKRGLWTTGINLVASVASEQAAEMAMDFLEAAPKGSEYSKSASDAARTLLKRIPALRLAAWEENELSQRARTLIVRVDPGFDLPPPPALQPRSNAVVTTPQPQRSPASDLTPFNAAETEQMELRFNGAVTFRGTQPPSHPERLITQAMTNLAPSFTARWALRYYCLGYADDYRALLVEALNAIDMQAATLRAPDVIDYDGAPFWVYGITAQIDFPLAQARAEALPPGWFKPLALAHVARFAAAAAKNRPENCQALLH